MAGLFGRLQTELEIRERVEGITPTDLLDLPTDLRRVINIVMRQRQMSLTDIVFELDLRPSEAREVLDLLVDKGYLRVFEVDGEQQYKTFLGRRRARDVPLDIWEALTSKLG
ncbi:MAG: hypothetical protein KKA73_05790 [Chloroflexi bacterium]|nr:hypothetical protein [Chloroflexota bacterium]MBU1747180.1 hypothetical protein [Chloroflexota bacterium]